MKFVIRDITFPPVVQIIILVNIAVYIVWSFSGGADSEPNFMIQNFLVSWVGLTEGRFWILITSAFSHIMLLHLFMNMFVLNSFGTIVENTLGFSRFIKFYIMASVTSSLSHALVSAWILKQPELPALGASGAVSGIVLLFSLMFPRQKILIFGLIPAPAIWGVVLLVGLDIWGLIAQAEGGGLPIGHGAHLGGAFTGIIYYLLFFRRRH